MWELKFAQQWSYTYPCHFTLSPWDNYFFTLLSLPNMALSMPSSLLTSKFVILLPVSLGEGIEIRVFLRPPASNLDLLLHPCDLPSLIPTVEFASLQNMENSWFVCWIPALLFYSRIFLEFASLISLHHQVFFFFLTTVLFSPLLK